MSGFSTTFSFAQSSATLRSAVPGDPRAKYKPRSLHASGGCPALPSHPGPWVLPASLAVRQRDPRERLPKAFVGAHPRRSAAPAHASATGLPPSWPPWSSFLRRLSWTPLTALCNFQALLSAMRCEADDNSRSVQETLSG